MKTLYFATGNEKKMEVAKKYLGQYFNLQQADIDVDEVQSDDQEYVAIKKVRSAFEILQKPVIVEDVGYYINKYHNFPGVMTKYVINGLGIDGIKQIINENDEGYFLGIFAYKDVEREFTVVEKIHGHFTYSYLDTCENKKYPFGKMFVPDGENQVRDKLLLMEQTKNDCLFDKLKEKILSM